MSERTSHCHLMRIVLPLIVFV